MPTFRSKPTEPEIIDARQFTGSYESAKDITNWFKANYEGPYINATLREKVTTLALGSVIDGEVSYPNELILTVANGDYFVYGGFWLVHRQDGTWVVWTDNQIKRKYDQV